MNVLMCGADVSVTNGTVSDYLTELQAFTGSGWLFDLTVSNKTSDDTDRYIWIFDLAAGTATSVKPVAWLACPSGMTTSLQAPAGGLWFANGCYLLLATDLPADPTTTATVGTANECIMWAGVRRRA